MAWTASDGSGTPILVATVLRTAMTLAVPLAPSTSASTVGSWL